MKDLSLHFFDILENSANAGATHVDFSLTYAGTWLHFYFRDNGPGFPPRILSDPADPFHTTRRERPAGLGLAFLKESMTATGGDLKAANREQGGAEVLGRIDMSHVDARPLGDLADTFMAAVISWPRLDLTLRIGPEGEADLILDTASIKRELEGVPIDNPEVRKYMRECLRERVENVRLWVLELQVRNFSRADRIGGGSRGADGAARPRA